MAAERLRPRRLQRRRYKATSSFLKNPLPKNPTTPLLSQINSSESHTLEFKSTFDKACIALLVAFANAQGGSVLVGVSDAGHRFRVMTFALFCL